MATTAVSATTAGGNEFTSFAKDNFNQSGGSGLYDASRPTYPKQAIKDILAQLPNRSTVVELGAGTGIFTRNFIDAVSTGAGGNKAIEKWIAVEPSEGMRKGFKDKWDGKSGVQMECVDGLFDEISVEDAKADLVCIAQAFHWVGSDGSKAIKEIARVLKPGGLCAMVWNLEDREQPWVAKVRDLYEHHEAGELAHSRGMPVIGERLLNLWVAGLCEGTPQYRLGLWKSIFQTEEYKSSFSEHSFKHYSQTLETNEDLVVNRALSKSYITSLSKEKQEELAEKIRDLVKGADDKVWIEEGKGTFEYPYTTDLFTFTRK
ncbi:BQ2448_4510 [Microbotryum intermedium]|uniref:BQ2448_4510 protein n=1 Tax=Microbotryum intermedium TaxID=269621 RepID=A0A238FL64_9BASI|nr:BQ2448_4510 [Microbotryum intermedium]